MQKVSQKEVVYKAYQIEKDLYQQRLVANSIREEIKNIQRDGRILQAINNNSGYSKGKKVNVQEETAWAYLEADSPYKRMQKTVEKPRFFNMFDSDVFGTFAVITIFVFIVSSIIVYVEDKTGHVRWIWNSYFWDSLLNSIKTGLLIGVIFFGILTLFYALIEGVKYHKKKGMYKRSFIEARKRNSYIKDYNKEQYKKRLILSQNLENEYNYLTQEIIKQTEENRKKLYSLGIIDRDYQNIVAISSFYQYFRTGRVDSLTGPFGAYNKYEEEKRQYLIITELRKILSSLEQIKDNQMALYEAIKEGQNVGNKMIQEVRKVQNQNDILIENSYVTKYNAEKSANNTEFLKWYAIFKN